VFVRKKNKAFKSEKDVEVKKGDIIRKSILGKPFNAQIKATKIRTVYLKQ